jgi:hypothetical protein
MEILLWRRRMGESFVLQLWRRSMVFLWRRSMVFRRLENFGYYYLLWSKSKSGPDTNNLKCLY